MPWYYWFNDNAASGAIEPPDSIKKPRELYDQLFQTPTTEGRTRS